MVARQNRLCQTMVCFLLLSLFGSFCARGEKLGAAKSPKPEAAVARVVSVNGTVTTGDRTLKPGEALAVGDVVKTGDDAGAKLLLSDGTIVDVGPRSSFRLDAFVPNSGADREVAVGVDNGKVRASIKKKLEGRGKFLIRTRASVLAVRGTELAIDVSGSADESIEEVWVREGTVAADPSSGGPSVAVPQGRRYQTRANRNAGQWSVRPGDSRVSPVSAQELEGFFTRATVSDLSFLQNVVIDPSAIHFRGRQTYALLNATFGASRPLPKNWRGDPSQLLRDHSPLHRNESLTLRRRGADHSIDIGGTNVPEANVSVIFKP